MFACGDARPTLTLDEGADHCRGARKAVARSSFLTGVPIASTSSGDAFPVRSDLRRLQFR
jgi:hypothetical protein